MSVIGIEVVQENIRQIFQRRIAALEALCLYYAARAQAELYKRQSANKYWTNRTYQALDRAFGRAFKEDGSVYGFFLAHGVQYGVYLEFARSGQNAALWPVVKDLVNPFLSDVAKIFGVQASSLGGQQ